MAEEPDDGGDLDADIQVEVDDEAIEEEDGDDVEVVEVTPPPVAAPASPPRPTELEGDEPEDAKSAKIQHEVALSSLDATPNVFFSAGGDVLSSLSQGGFKYLTSAVRADTGAKAGRYVFEVKVLERTASAPQLLRVGFSAAGSSLFLGDGSPENVCFDAEGTFYMADPGDATVTTKPGACRRLPARRVVSLLLNLAQDRPNANTVSVFLDGVRAGPPMPIPSHLRGKALYPTISFRNQTLAVNFGRGGRRLQPLPFRCSMFSELALAHAERLPLPAAPGASPGRSSALEVVVPVGLPGEGFFDFIERFAEEHPDYFELSDRRVYDWCLKSELRPQRTPDSHGSRDRPDFAFGHAGLDNKSWRPSMASLAQLSGRSVLLADLRSGLLKAEREEFLRSFPHAARKVAVVVMGEPSSDFKRWVHGRIRRQWETAKEVVDRRRNIAEARGDQLSPEELALPPEPAAGDDVWLLPRGKATIPDMGEKALACTYDKFSLPSKAEGFDEVRFEWAGEAAAAEHLRRWVLERKATFLVEGLRPGPWFQRRFEEWNSSKMALRDKHREFQTRLKQSRGADGEDASSSWASTVVLSDVQDVHSADGKGTPVYGHFKYEDWLVLSWRFQLHLLAHAWALDVDDPDRPGIPEDHVPHYYAVYFGAQWSLRSLFGIDTLPQLLKILKDPVELVEVPGQQRILKSKLDKDTSLEAFIISVESYRRDRCRRIEAGDESAQLSVPTAPKRPAAAPPKEATNAAGRPAAGQTPTTQAAAPKGPPLMKPTQPKGPPPAKAAVGKGPPAKAKAVPEATAPGKASRPAPKGPGAGAAAAPAQAQKRPLAAVGVEEDPAAKRPRPGGLAGVAGPPARTAGAQQGGLPKAPVVKANGKAAIAKRKPE